MSKVLVCGGRDWNDEELTFWWLDELDKEYKFTEVIHGAAKGADTHSHNWANAEERIGHTFPCPEWGKHGKAAGLIRNQEMLSEGQPDLVVAFPGGRGTAHMVGIAKLGKVPVIQFEMIEGEDGPCLVQIQSGSLL